MKKRLICLYSNLVMFFIIFCLLGCASTSGYKEYSVSEFQNEYRNLLEKGKSTRQGFIVEGYINSYSSYDHSIRISDVMNNNEGFLLYLHGYGNCSDRTDHIHSKQVEFYRKDDLDIRIDKTKKHTIYIGFYYRSGQNNDLGRPFADKIIGLRTDDEVIIARNQIEANRNAETEARRLAQEEADRYDSSKYTIVPSNFRPSRYTSIDLFEAVSVIERMRGVNPNSRNTGLGDLALTTRDFVSDVVFVSQNGTDILFKTPDNAISQYMKVDGRSGLMPDQMVRLFYRVTKHPLADWRVVAIERL